MKAMQLMEGWVFNDKNPNAEPLFVAPDGRILRFALRPGQAVREHSAPHSPVYVVLLKGQGMFAGADGKEREFGPNTLLTFDAGETHSIRAVDEELVFVTFLREAPGVGQFPSRTANEHKGSHRKV
jgi:quercetin dioxygenase-like cupin family protein